MGTAYAFVSRWELPATPDRCWDALEATLDGSASWWPAVRVTEPAVARVGDTVGVVVRSPLGHRLRMRARIVHADPPTQLIAASTGDLTGIGRIRIEPARDGESDVTVHWDVRTEQPWMNRTAWILRPVFAAAHAAVMRSGARALSAHLREVRP